MTIESLMFCINQTKILYEFTNIKFTFDIFLFLAHMGDAILSLQNLFTSINVRIQTNKQTLFTFL